MRCDYCTLPLQGRERFCSKQCFECARAGTPAIERTCPPCGRRFNVPVGYARTRTYCSRMCYRTYHNQHRMRGARNGRWRGGRALSYGPGWKQIREQVRARDRVCRACGITPERNGRALDVHHLEPFRFSGEHDLDGLVALCRSCHMRADDHGRAGSAAFLRAANRPLRPTKREVRAYRAHLRAIARAEARRAGRLRAERLATEGRSLRQIARALRVSHQTVANWLSAREPSAGTGPSG